MHTAGATAGSTTILIVIIVSGVVVVSVCIRKVKGYKTGEGFTVKGL